VQTWKHEAEQSMHIEPTCRGKHTSASHIFRTTVHRVLTPVRNPLDSVAQVSGAALCNPFGHVAAKAHVLAGVTRAKEVV
jgi:hypothetical protein